MTTTMTTTMSLNRSQVLFDRFVNVIGSQTAWNGRLAHDVRISAGLKPETRHLKPETRHLKPDAPET